MQWTSATWVTFQTFSQSPGANSKALPFPSHNFALSSSLEQADLMWPMGKSLRCCKTRGLSWLAFLLCGVISKKKVDVKNHPMERLWSYLLGISEYSPFHSLLCGRLKTKWSTRGSSCKPHTDHPWTTSFSKQCSASTASTLASPTEIMFHGSQLSPRKLQTI